MIPTSSPFVFTSAPPELPLIDRRVGLQEVLVAAVATPPGFVRPLALMIPIVTVWPTSERVADRQHDVADLHGFRSRRARWLGGPCRSTLSSARSLGSSVPIDLRGERPAVGEVDADVVRAFDDVVVREDVAVGRDHHARAQRALALPRHRHLTRVQGCRKTARRTRRQATGTAWAIPVARPCARTVTTAGDTTSTMSAYESRPPATARAIGDCAVAARSDRLRHRAAIVCGPAVPRRASHQEQPR